MLFRERMALGVAPLFIRVALAVTLIWAGAGKLFFKDMQVQGEQAAILANMGVDITPTGATAPPADDTPANEAPADDAGAGDADTGAVEDPVGNPPAESTEQATPDPAEQAPEETGEQTPEETEPPIATPVRQQTAAPGAFTAEQFPTATPVRRVYGVALMLHDATSPDGILPDALGAGSRPRFLAWMAGLTEFFGGCFIALGFFTRLWALAAFGTMAMAMWITQIGPVIAGGATGTLGFLPAIDDFQIQAWQVFLWQLVLACASLSLFFSGPGPVAFDVLFGPGRGAARSKSSGENANA